MQQILQKHMKSIEIKFVTSLLASIEPVEAQLKENAKPKRPSQQRYGLIQQHFIEETISNLEKSLAVYCNLNAK